MKNLWMVCLLIIAVGCSSGGSSGGGGVAVSATSGNAPQFAGLRGIAAMVEQDGRWGVELQWRAPNAASTLDQKARVSIYASKSPIVSGREILVDLVEIASVEATDEKFVVRAQHLAAGSGEQIYFLARACVPGQICDDNTTVLTVKIPAAANQLFVDLSQAGGDGSRSNPFGSFAEAMQSANAMGEATLLVTGGMTTQVLEIESSSKLQIFGGFKSDFSFGERAVRDFSTLIDRSGADAGLLALESSSFILDGVAFIGSNFGVHAYNPQDSQISNCEFGDDSSTLYEGVLVEGNGTVPSQLSVVGCEFENMQNYAMRANVDFSFLQFDNNSIEGHDVDAVYLEEVNLTQGEYSIFRICHNVQRGGGFGSFVYSNFQTGFGPDGGYEFIIEDNNVRGLDDGIVLMNYSICQSPSKIFIQENTISNYGNIGIAFEWSPTLMPNAELEVDISHNEIRSGHGGMILDVVAGANHETSWNFVNNQVKNQYGNGIELNSRYSNTADRHNGAMLNIHVEACEFGNCYTGDLFFDLATAHQGFTVFDVANNSFSYCDESSVEGTISARMGDSSSYSEGIWGTTLCTIRNNEFEGAYDSFIKLDQADDFIRSIYAQVGNHFRENEWDAAVSVDLKDNSSFYSARNLVHDISNDYAPGYELASGFPAAAKIQNDLIFRTGQDGIYWNGAPGLQVENTTIHSCGRNDSYGIHDRAADRDSSAYVVNSVITDNLAADLHESITPVYSMLSAINDNMGIGSSYGDPLYDYGFEMTDIINYFEFADSSTAKNGGHPSQDYRNVDGTRSTMGHTGGQFAGPMGDTARASYFVGMATWPLASLENGGFLLSDDTSLEFIFTEAVDAASVNSDRVKVTIDGAAVVGDLSVDGSIVKFTPLEDWPLAAQVDIEASGLRSEGGKLLEVAYTNKLFTEASQTASVGDVPADFDSAPTIQADVYSTSGTLSNSTDVDAFKFTLNERERLQATVYSRRLDITNDTFTRILIYNSTGQRLHIFEGAFSGDPMCDFTAPASDDYLLVIEARSSFSTAKAYRLVSVVR